MITEKSCGAVVFTQDSSGIKYVIVESKEGYFGFPKGHTEGSETEEETAYREILEETGLSVQIIDGFITEDIHTFTIEGEIRMKYIVYFVAEYSCQTPIPQISELNGIYIMDFESALTSFQFESSKRILKEAHSFITKSIKNF